MFKTARAEVTNNRKSNIKHLNFLSQQLLLYNSAILRWFLWRLIIPTCDVNPHYHTHSVNAIWLASNSDGFYRGEALQYHLTSMMSIRPIQLLVLVLWCAMHSESQVCSFSSTLLVPCYWCTLAIIANIIMIQSICFSSLMHICNGCACFSKIIVYLSFIC